MEDKEADCEMKKANGIGSEAIGVQGLPLASGLVPPARRFL